MTHLVWLPGRSLYSCKQGRNRKIFLRGQSHFSWFFFPGVKCFFPVENFHFGRPKTNFSRFEKWKEKKERKKEKKKEEEEKSPLLILELFPHFIFNFPPSLLQFSFFSSPFSHLFHFFLASSFPVGQQKCLGQKSLGELCHPPPPTCYATGCKPLIAYRQWDSAIYF